MLVAAGESLVGFFSNLRIAQKVTAGLSLLALLSVFIAGFGAYQLSIMAERSAELVEQQARSMKLAALANENKSRLHQLWYATVIENDVPDFRQQLVEIAAERRELDGRLQELRGHLTGDDARQFELLRRDLRTIIPRRPRSRHIGMRGERKRPRTLSSIPHRMPTR